MPSSRFIRTLLMAALIVTVVGICAPPAAWINTGVPSDAFWIDKAFPTRQYDMVLAGDSRVLKGLSPAAMQEVLPDDKIFNFGFDHNAFTEEYLAACAGLLEAVGRRRTIVLGISPQSLTPEAAQNNGFLELRANGHFKRFSMRYLSPYLAFFQPYNVYLFWDLLNGQPRVKYYQHHFPDGWVASHKVPEDPGYQIARYQGRFDGNTVSPAMVRQLVDFVRQWRSQGIEVYGLRLPSSQAMLQLENQHSGFDQSAFRSVFEAAGGVWIDFRGTAYHSYDGSHLREDAARRLSADLALEIRRARKALETNSVDAGNNPGQGS